MFLPLRMAVSLPVTAAALIALAIGIASPSLRAIHPVYKMPNAGFAMFFAAAAALIVVLPNLAAAFAANRWSNGNALVWIGLFAGVFALAWWGQARFLDGFLRQLGGFKMGTDWRTWAPLGANVVLCLGAAAWFGRTGHA